MTDIAEMQSRSDSRNTRLVGYHDLNGHGDGMQVVKRGQFVYVAHLGTSDMALSILDCSNPEKPELVRQIEHLPDTHSHKVQIVGDTLIQNCERPYFKKLDPNARPVTGLAVYSLEDPADPVQVGFHDVVGTGVHRLWYSDPPYAHIAAYLPGGSARGYQIVDLSDPAVPRMVGSWWIPGTHQDDVDGWRPIPGEEKYAVHGIIVHGNRAYVSCTDAGMVILDISDMNAPQFISRTDWNPPYGGYVHTALPLPGRGLVVATCESVRPTREEDGDKRVWIIDVRDERRPVTIATFPIPTPPQGSPWGSYDDRPLRFGPHNLHENRPGSFQSETLMFVTYFNAGLRVVDISDAHRPTEVGHFVPPSPAGQEAPQLNDLYVDEDALVYMTDRITGGMYIVEYTG